MKVIANDPPYLIIFQQYLGQVAQLWQRDRAKLDTFSINVISVIRKIMHNIGFLGHPMGASRAI